MRSLVCLFLVTSLAHAADLSLIEKRILEEPKYSAPSQYFALLVLGANADTHVWFVVDGSTLHIDRDADLHLRKGEEQIRSTVQTSPSGFTLSSREWTLSRLVTGGTRYTQIKVRFSKLNPQWQPAANASNRKHMRRFMRLVRHTPNANISSIQVTIDGKRTQFCNAMFATSPEKAPIFHMDGPLTLGVIETIMPGRLERGNPPRDFRVAVGTPGHGAGQSGCFSYVMYGEFAEDVRPRASIEFPSKEPGKYLAARRHPIQGRC